MMFGPRERADRQETFLSFEHDTTGNRSSKHTPSPETEALPSCESHLISGAPFWACSCSKKPKQLVRPRVKTSELHYSMTLE